MNNSPFKAAIERYRKAIENLSYGNTTSSTEQVLEILNARDAVHAALKQQTRISTTKLREIIELDTKLKSQAKKITQVINQDASEQLAQWRDSVHPLEEDWWWNLESIAPYRWNAFYKLATAIFLVINASVLVHIIIRFFNVNIGFWQACGIFVSSTITLLQARGEFTKTGQEFSDELLTQLKIPQYFREQTKLFSTLAVTILIFSVLLSLPNISHWYSNNGWEHYQKGRMGSAEQDYLRAISIDPNNVKAHQRLGSLYEDLNNFEQAQRHYLIAAKGNSPKAYNNLARLNIQKGKYSEAVALLQRGLKFADSQPKVQYFLYKNLGWARFKQRRYQEAEPILQAAVAIANDNTATEEIIEPSSAHCLLAQVLDKQKKTDAIEQWQKCCQLGSQYNPDEDKWLHLAQQKLKEVGKTCKD